MTSKTSISVSSSLSKTIDVAPTSALAGLFSENSKNQFARLTKAEEFEKKRSDITLKVNSVEQKKLDLKAQKKLEKKAKRKGKTMSEPVPEIQGDDSYVLEPSIGTKSVELNPNQHEKDSRTVFLGNLPISENVKSITKFCTEFGEVDSVRLRSVPIAGTAVDEAGNQNLVKKVSTNKKLFGTQKGSLNAYVVFKDRSAVSRALKANNRIIGASDNAQSADAGLKSTGKGRHLRVDLVNPTLFDPRKSVFIGALPHYADEEEVREHFAAVLPNGQDDIENIRLIRDPETLIGKGVGYLLLSSNDAVMQALSLHKEKYRKRWELRVTVCGKRTKRTEADKHIKAGDKAAVTVEDAKQSGKKRIREESSSVSTSDKDVASSAEINVDDGAGQNKKKMRWRNMDPADVPQRKPIAVNASAALKRMQQKQAARIKSLKTVNTRKKILTERGQMKKDGRKGKRLGGNVKKAMKAQKKAGL